MQAHIFSSRKLSKLNSSRKNLLSIFPDLPYLESDLNELPASPRMIWNILPGRHPLACDGAHFWRGTQFHGSLQAVNKLVVYHYDWVLFHWLKLGCYETLQIMDREYIENLTASLVREYLSRKVSLLAITHPNVQVTIVISLSKRLLDNALTERWAYFKILFLQLVYVAVSSIHPLLQGTSAVFAFHFGSVSQHHRQQTEVKDMQKLDRTHGCHK